MKDSLAPGATRTERIDVDRGRTIGFLGEAMRVYATPSMVDDVEYACLRLVQEHLDEGESSVGTRVSMDHLGATPLGETVEITVAVTAVDGRSVTMSAEVRDRLETVGRGRHTRFVIDVARHARRLEDKAARLAAKEG